MQITLVELNIFTIAQLRKLLNNVDIATVCSTVKVRKLINTPYERYIDFSSLAPDDITWLLCKYPQFADKCKFDVLAGHNWSFLLRKQPQFADKCDWSKLNGFDWGRLLEAQPQFADKCDWSKLRGQVWTRLLKVQPQFATVSVTKS